MPDPSAAPAASAPWSASPAPACPVRVILVDDDPLTRAAIKPLLRPREDYVVVAEAGDGREAIDVVGRIEADIVLMDLGMPVMDGIEATRQICAAPRHPHVVALTTWDVDDAVVRVIEAGACSSTPPPRSSMPGCVGSWRVSRCSRRGHLLSCCDTCVASRRHRRLRLMTFALRSVSTRWLRPGRQRQGSVDASLRSLRRPPRG